MDVYSGIYLESDDSDFVPVSPDDERLLVVQLRVVSRPFLEIRDNGTDHIVTLQDPIEIWEYCFDSDHRVGDCPTPAQETLPKKKFPAALDQQPQEVLETLSRLEPSSPLKGQPEDEEGKEDPGVRIDQDRNEQLSDTKIEESSPAAENDPIQDTSSPNDNGTEAKVDIDDDDSQDSEEDRDLIAWADNDGAQEDDDSRRLDDFVRYEIAH
ncbi:MAG: hypothetical protein Q9194_007163 [Teloschistes cf. exilis]